MINLIQLVKEQIENCIFSACEKGYSAELLEGVRDMAIEVETPKDPANGDFSTNFCMQAAKKLRSAPGQIAKIVVENMDLAGTYFEKAEQKGPGFINFTLNQTFFVDTLQAIQKMGKDYGKTDFGQKKKVLVEFVSANPTGPMHIGNARGGVIGDCLSECLSWAGYDVSREFYVNDAGNQVEKFYESLWARYVQNLLGEDACVFPEDGYHGDDIKERVREFIALYGDVYLNAPKEDGKKALVDYALTKNVDGLKNDLGRYRIVYDTWFHESELYNQGDVEETLALLKKGKYTYERDGAIWFLATEFGCEKDEVLVRANGLCTYFAADIAYHRNKILKRGFMHCIDVWGADHHGHVARMKGALDAVGLDGNQLDVVLMQLVRLVADGEVIKVSKRSGKAISLTDLLDEVGVDAARFFFNTRASDTHLEFDLELAKENSSQNPVYYVQYAHARICSILRLIEKEGERIETVCAQADKLSNLIEVQERELMDLLARFPEEVRQVALQYEPARIINYILQVAASFHRFYNAHRVNCEDAALRQSRIVLVKSVQIVLENALSILKVTAPEKM